MAGIVIENNYESRDQEKFFSAEKLGKTEDLLFVKLQTFEGTSKQTLISAYFKIKMSELLSII